MSDITCDFCGGDLRCDDADQDSCVCGYAQALQADVEAAREAAWHAMHDEQWSAAMDVDESECPF